MSLHLLTQTSTYTLSLTGWQLAIVIALVAVVVWAIRGWGALDRTDKN